MREPSLYNIKAGTDLTFAHFQQMERLEASFYSHDFITPAEEAYRWYIEHPRTTVAAFDESGLAGFVNLIPVDEELLELITTGRFNDAELTAEDIPAFSSLRKDPRIRESFGLFLSCIIVETRLRGTGLSKSLLREALALYTPPANSLTRIVTDNVTDAGARFSEKLGFRFVTASDHSSRIYATTLGELQMRLR